MTRPAGSKLNKHSQDCSLVLDGREVKFRLLAERQETQTPVHVDWLRFTCQIRNAPLPCVDVLFPDYDQQGDDESAHEHDVRKNRLDWLAKSLRQLPAEEHAPGYLALELASKVADALGDDFSVNREVKKGHDFYRHRISLERHGAEVGWIGFLASGDSPRQKAQSKTLHVNLYGTACTFARSGWRDAMADLVDETEATITRVDLALDFFEGIAGGMDRIKSDYESGLMNSGGKRLKCNMVGDWSQSSEGGRSFYIGSKEAGKQTNVYEKGDQLFGVQENNPWQRIELRYGNKFRVFPSDVLRRPADFFAGASDWHAAMLREVEKTEVIPQPVACEKRLQDESILAEVTRNVRWLREIAGPSLSLAFQYMRENDFLSMVTPQQLPRRLAKFSLSEIKTALNGTIRKAFHAASPASLQPA